MPPIETSDAHITVPPVDKYPSIIESAEILNDSPMNRFLTETDDPYATDDDTDNKSPNNDDRRTDKEPEIDASESILVSPVTPNRP